MFDEVVSNKDTCI